MSEYEEFEEESIESGPESLNDPNRMPPDLAGKIKAGVGLHARDKALKVAAELARRQVEPLNLYQPTPKQEEYHACTAKEAIFQAGNQVGKALANDEPVFTPTGCVPIGDLKIGDVVLDGNGEPTTVTGVFPQGLKPMKRLVFDDGVSVVACDEHLWKCKLTKRERFRGGDWSVRSTKEIEGFAGREPHPTKRAAIPTAVARFDEQDVPLDPYLLGCLTGDGSLSGGGVEFATADQQIADSLILPDDHVVVKKKSSKYAFTIRNKWPTHGSRNGNVHRTENEVLQALKSLGLWGKRSEDKFIPAEYLFNSVGARLLLLRGLMDTDGSVTAKGNCEFCTTSPQLAKDFVFLVQSLGGKCKTQWRTTHYTNAQGQRIPGRPSARIRVRMWYANPFHLARKASRWFRPTSRSDSRFLYRIEDAGVQEATCITVSSEDRTFLTRGFIVTHNSLAGFIEDARAVLNMDPHNKYPKSGVLAIVGYKESHIALNIHRYLLQPGAFEIIRDEETGLWRPYHPWVPADKARMKEAIPAPPMIPERYIKSINWKSKSGCIFKRIDLTTGWQIYAFSSTAKPDQGFKLDLGHIDEDIINEQWYTELQGRLLMRNGKLRWTALPHNENDAINRLVERGETEMAAHARGGPEPTTVVIRATIYDNPYMPEEARQEAVKRWKAMGDDVYRARALGELVTDSVRMYPTFSENTHAVQRYGESHGELFGEYLKTREIPDDWCLRLFVDPGYDTLGALLIATLPNEACHVAVRELYIRQCTPSMFALQLDRLLQGRTVQCHYMDAHGGALTSIADGRRPQEVYEQEMRKRKLLSVETQYRFRAACDSIQFRETQLRERLAIMPGGNGLPEMMFDEEFCPNLLMEMVRFRKQKVKGHVIDKGNRKRLDHLVDCYEYAAAEPLPYVKPPARKKTESRSERRVRAYMERKAAKRRKAAAAYGNLEGGIILGS